MPFMNARVVSLASLLALSAAIACGGQTTDGTGFTNTGGGGASAAGGSSSGGTGAGTSVGGSSNGGVGGTGNGCGGPLPDCGNCGLGGPSFPPMCIGGAWVCPSVDCPPPTQPTCASASQCNGATFCSAGKNHCPTAATPGICVGKPSTCDDIGDPHCGCFSGKVYGNECDANAAGEPAFPCSTGVGGSGGGGGTGAGGGPGKACGGIVGASCPSGYYCDFPDKNCGANDGGGTCLPGPIDKCGGDGLVCGCDGKVYGSACQAELAGVDVSLLGACKEPPGTFVCGTHYCKLGLEYCEVDLSDVSGFANGYGCHTLPIQCGDGTGDCACLAGVPCGNQCKGGSGSLFAICPGG